MGVLTRIGELIKAFSMPQQESEWQDEDINPNKLATIAQQSGLKPEDIEELKRGYQKQESREQKFRREQAEAAQQSEDAKSERKRQSKQLENKIQEEPSRGEGKQSPTRNQGIEQEL